MNWRSALGSLSTSLAFLTRIPLPSFLFRDHIAASSAAWGFPVVGLLIGVVQALVLGLLVALGLHSVVVAVLVMGGSIMLTGALHEDGLGDVADSLGGGTRERKLDIMKDSRLGTFGVLVGASVVSRALMTVVWAVLPAASAQGLGSQRPSLVTGLVALAIGCAVLVALMPLAGMIILVGTLFAIITAVAFALFARWQYGGVTGDVCGATQILTELAFYAAALSLMS